MKKQILWLLSPLAITPVAIIASCANTNSSNNMTNSLNEEVVRINDLNLDLKNNNQLLTFEDVAKINEQNLLNQYLNNWNPNANFDYKIMHLTKDPFNAKAMSFTIAIKNRNNQIQNSKQFVLRLSMQNYLDQDLLDQEVERLNNLELKSIYWEDENTLNDQLSRLGEIGFLKKLEPQLNENNNLFTYKIEQSDYSKDFTTNTISFKIQVKIKGLTKKTNQLKIKFINANTQFSNDEFKSELSRIEKLKSQLKLINSKMTIHEVRDFRIENLWDQISGFEANQNGKFTYKIDGLYKANEGQIQFQIAPYWKELEHQIWNKEFVTFQLPYQLVPVTKNETVKTDYFQHQAKPITTGQNYLAKPGTGSESIIPSGQTGATHPSDGVEENAQLMTGKIFTELERRQLKNTFALGFQTPRDVYSFGTGWILDYQLSEDGSYPTTWYIATNAHVIQNLKSPNDVLYSERYESELEPYQNTLNLDMLTIKDPKLDTQYHDTSDYKNYLRAFIPAANVRTVFVGNDFLTTKPSDFSSQGRWASSEEYIDFAVLEVKFSTPEEAKSMTQNYVEETDRHFKYRQNSLLNDNAQVLKDGYSVLGFPVVEKGTSTSFWRDLELKSSRPANLSDDQKNKFSNLSSSINYNSFENKTGMFDAALGLSFFNYDYREANSLTTNYINWGLIYPLDYGNLGPGSSGSMLMDAEGYAMGIHYAIDKPASTGFSIALYNEGFSYGGKFNKYNLEGYDLINGNVNGKFPNQKKSYRQSLELLKGSKFKTNLFPNGLNQPMRKM